jgi:hypothetical protein
MEGGARVGVSKGGGLGGGRAGAALASASAELGRAGVKSCRWVCGAIRPASPETSAISCPCHCPSPLSSLPISLPRMALSMDLLQVRDAH